METAYALDHFSDDYNFEGALMRIPDVERQRPPAGEVIGDTRSGVHIEKWIMIK